MIAVTCCISSQIVAPSTVTDRSYMLSLVTDSSAIYINDRSYMLSLVTDSRTARSHLAKNKIVSFENV